VRRDASDTHYLRVAQLFTAGWGVLAVLSRRWRRWSTT